VMSMDRFVRRGEWSGFTKSHPLRRVSQLTLGLVGLGRIARATARKMAGFQMRILASDPFVKGPTDGGTEIVPLETLLRESDLISVHVPLMPETRGMINAAAFKLMKPTAVLVNTSRGPVVDQEALITALREKRIGGAALDVVAEEPLPGSSPLRDFDSVILTPHTGADSVDSMAHVRRTVVESVSAGLAGYWPPFPINPKVTPRAALKPFAEYTQP
jgi:D-3-phosphoglycerate dehydrogenase